MVSTGFSAMILFWLICLGFALAATVFWIWVLLDCITNEPAEGSERIIWVLVIVLLHLLGALIYYFGRKPTRVAQYGK